MRETPVLVVDDDPRSAEYLTLALEQDFESVRSASGGVGALLAMERQVPGLVITDLRMPGVDGLELLTHIKERWPEVPVILVSVEQDVATIVEAVHRGAINYLVKPVSPAVLHSAAAKALATTTAFRTVADLGAPEIVGVSPAMVEVRHQVALAARTDVNVLVTGETGTGKELVARAIHRLSSLAGGPFVAHNCALTPSELFDSHFFGHRRGAFTGADRDHVGLLEEADGGILFLDELECLAPTNQAKLLRVLDGGEVRSLGSSETRPVALRFLAATNRDPARMLAENVLREDLYYRLRGFEVRLPPLKERPEDIPLLAAHFVGGDGPFLTAEAVDVLREHAWPGNVRQLQNVLRSALAQAHDGPIAPRHLALESTGSATRSRSIGGTLELKALERRAILQALEQHRGNRSRAARALGIDRSTLRRKLREYAIDAGHDHG